MPKRKRDSNDDLEETLRKQLEQGKKVLTRNLKLARGFERQKLGRRQKDALAKHDTADNVRIEAEIAALKKLDMQATAEHHLHKTLRRIKSIANTGALSIAQQDLPTTLPDVATANVTARLYNAKLVKDALATTIEGIRQTLGLNTTERPAKRVERLAEDIEEDEWKGFSDDLSENEAGTSGDDTREADSHNIDSSDYNSEDFAAFDARMASSSEEDDSEIEGMRDSSAAQLRRELTEAAANTKDASVVVQGHGLRANGMTAIDSRDESSEFAKPQSTSLKLKPTTSAFLPALTMGGYWSGSEGDEPEDIEEHVAPRKNRRGQRARQAIAEAKFGEAAKHIVEGRPANKPKDARDAGWDMKRGATNSEDARGFKGMARKERRGRMVAARKAGASGGNAIPIASGKGAVSVGFTPNVEKPTVSKPKRDDIGSLHPSWEAKRKAKAATGKIVPFQGTKITFD